jgi:cellulose synthase/poly-beta-1,6-N-acetylglucosamine synthase-like glycosyltransferase
MIPFLMITYNRLEYTKEALSWVLMSDCDAIHVFDNGSTDGTVDYLRKAGACFDIYTHYNGHNGGIYEAWNWFLEQTKDCEFVGKCDNDTILPPDFCNKMLPHMEKADIVQARHKLIDASGVGTFDEWTSNMPADGTLRFNNFVGGTGIMCRRSVLSPLKKTDKVLMPWRQWQRDNPKVRKAFATDVNIRLLDEHGYSDYPEYYKQTGRC